MRPIRIYRVSALVLRHRDLGEADQIVVLLSRERGKFSAVAKGVKRPRSKLAAGLQLFTHSRLLLASGQNLDIVSQCQIVRSFYHLREDLAQVAHASHLVELVDGFLQEREPVGQVFELLLWALDQLETGDDPELIARAFELKLMSALGYQPRLVSCASCGKELASGPLSFSPDLGGAVCSVCQDQSANSLQVSFPTLATAQQLVDARLAEIPQIELPPEVRQKLEQAIRMYIEYHLERQLRSSRFIRDLKSKIK